jgi:hypothetical protein
MDQIGHNAVKVHATAATYTTTGSVAYTGPWVDISGWTDKSVVIDLQGGGVNLIAEFSPYHVYELNNSGTPTNNSHSVTLNGTTAALTATGLNEYDGADVEDLQRPHRSVRIKISPTTTATVGEVLLNGWS